MSKEATKRARESKYFTPQELEGMHVNPDIERAYTRGFVAGTNKANELSKTLTLSRKQQRKQKIAELLKLLLEDL